MIFKNNIINFFLSILYCLSEYTYSLLGVRVLSIKCMQKKKLKSAKFDIEGSHLVSIFSPANGSSEKYRRGHLKERKDKNER